MEITTREYIVRIRIIQISGRLEALTVHSLREEQEKHLEAGETHFIVDLSKLTFMDSSGMAALVSLLKRARQASGDVVLVKPQEPAAYRVLSLTRFDQVFKITENVDDAIKQF